MEKSAAATTAGADAMLARREKAIFDFSTVAVAQIIQNNTKSSLLYYVLYVLIVLCIV
jgi:hypothetical protein